MGVVVVVVVVVVVGGDTLLRAHGMETFSTLLTLSERNPPVTDSPHLCGWGLGSFSKVVVTFNHLGETFKSPQFWVTLCIQFVSTAASLPHVKTICAKSYIFGTKNIWVWGNLLDDFLWPWPKVTAVALINTNLLFCMIKWEPLIQSPQNFVALSP